jgi:hypothetical protein
MTGGTDRKKCSFWQSSLWPVYQTGIFRKRGGMDQSVTWLALDRAAGVWFSAEEWTSFIFTTSRPAVDPLTLLPIGICDLCPLGGNWAGTKLTTHLCLVPSFRTRGELHPRPQHSFMGWRLGTVVTNNLPFTSTTTKGYALEFFKLVI